MSADLLREAAALMRQRAEAATPGPWHTEAGLHGDLFLVLDIQRTPYGDNSLSCGEDRGTAEHIASWHPAVALAVADWLDAAAGDAWEQGPPLTEIEAATLAPHVLLALVVARAYLGRES